MSSDVMSDDRSAVLIGAAMAPPLIWRIGIAYLRMKRRSRRAEKTFRKALLAGGVPESYAKQLTNEFSSYLSIRQLLKGIGPGFPGIKGFGD
jgi:hypothetical protein